MGSYETVNYRVSERVAMIELNRPQSLNAFNTPLRRDLLAAVTQANAEPGVRVVIITGAGRGFSAGADLKAGFAEYETIEEQILLEYKPVLMAIVESEKLYIAAVNGPCAGIGSALAMACDLMVMADDAYIYQAFAAIGLVPDGGATWQLVHAMGYRRALQLVVEAGKLTADQCLTYGLANKVVPAGELSAQAQAWAAELAKGSPLAQKYSKKLLKAAITAELPEMIDHEASTQNITISSEDSKNAVLAFFKKRRPEFTGR